MTRSSARPRLAALAAAAALAACASSEPTDGAPRPTSVAPPSGYQDGETEIAIAGDGFRPEPYQTASGPEVDATFRAWLGATELAAVRWVSDRELRARVPPGLPAGTHRLEVRDPRGATGALDGAFTVFAGAPPALAVRAALVPSVASLGQPVTFRIEVTNGGDVGARTVRPSFRVTGDALALPSGAVPARDVPSGATEAFELTGTAGALGTASVVASAAGIDPVSGATVTAPESAPAALLVQPPSLLASSADAAPGQASVGQLVAIDAVFDNAAGAAPVSGLQPSAATAGSGALLPLAAPGPCDVPSGGRCTATFLFRAAAPGPVAIAVDASGTDANSGAPVAAPRAFTAVLVQRPPALVGLLSAAPVRANVGQALTLVLEVSNGGEADARGVLPEVTAAPVGAELLGSEPAAQDVPAGATRSFSWSFVAREAGTGMFAAQAAGWDANGAGTVVLPRVLSNDVFLDAPANLQAVASSSPLRVTAGGDVRVELDVTNLGQAAARVTPALAGTAGGTASWSADPLGATTIAGASTVRFAWTARTAGSGTISFAPRVDGTDANSGAPAAAWADAGTVLVQAPPALRAVLSAPPVANEGRSIAVALDVMNDGEAAAAGVVPDLVSSGTATWAAGPSPPPPVRVAGGASARFAWTYAAGAAPGSASFTATVAGVDENAPAVPALAAPASAGPVRIQRAATLQIAFVSAPAEVNLDQPFGVRLRVTNTGDSTARDVVPAVACGGCVPLAAPAPVSVAGGEWVEVVRSATAVSLGAWTLRASAAGFDAVDASTVASAVIEGALAVQRPATLVAVSSVGATVVSAGQAFPLSLRVTNAGEADADVDPSLSGTATGAAAWSAAPLDGPLRIAGGMSAQFRWTVTPSGAGTLSFLPRVDGVDANDGTALSAADPTPVVTVQVPAALAAALLVPAVVNGGQTFPVVLEVTNGGDAAAIGVSGAVTPAGPASYASGPTPPPPLRLPGASALRFTWTYAAGAAPGTIQLDAGATGTDENSTFPLSATAVRRTVPVQRAAELSCEIVAAPARVNVSRPFAVTVRVSNAGDSAATGVSAALGCPSCTPAAPPAAVDVAGHATADATRWFTPDVLGTTALTASASGTDATDGAARFASTVERPLSIELPARLSAWFAPPSSVPMVGFPVALDVENPISVPGTPQADATGVLPGPLAVVPDPGYLGTADVTCTPAPAAPAVIPAGARATFRWTCTAARVGQVKLSGSAAGADGNGLDPLLATTEAVFSVEEAAQIPGDPFAATTATTAFSYVFAYDGHVFLGPTGDGRGLVRCAPDGTACEPWALSFLRDTTSWVFRVFPWEQTSTSENTVCPTLVTLGARPQCDENNPASTACSCGPDYESGRGIVTSFRLGTGQDEWLVAMGRAKKSGDLNYLYMTRETASPLPMSYVDLYAAMPATARVENVVSMAVLNDRLYLGLQVDSADRPRVVVLTRTPPSPRSAGSPGLDAVSSEAFAMTFQRTVIGETGGGAGNPYSQMDAMLGFEGRLFVANRKGVLASKTGYPPADLVDGRQHFDDCTPTDPTAWAGASSPYLGKIDVTPADKAVTALVAWGGRLFLSRNTAANVPELWVLTPRHDLVTGAFLGCAADRSDWRRVVTNMGDAGNTHLTALFATSRYLYVGYDNAARGVQLWRTASADPAGVADFTGRQGCVAGTSGGGGPCEPVGRAGFGSAANARFLDARGLAFGGSDHVWTTVGDGVTTARVFRVSE
ncbi:MAG TPA: IPT/TIG domain-containing protein [Anaeromyxobacter sp.]|nr:IPT/TIG domain-containing protein [Anaeromyxobacter sp.]